MDMTEFGEAAPFLRKSDLEIFPAHTTAFDGSPDETRLSDFNTCFTTDTNISFLFEIFDAFLRVGFRCMLLIIR